MTTQEYCVLTEVGRPNFKILGIEVVYWNMQAKDVNWILFTF